MSWNASRVSLTDTIDQLAISRPFSMLMLKPASNIHSLITELVTGYQTENLINY